MDESNADGHDDPDYNTPLHLKRAFGGAGIKRKRHVEFVPQSNPHPSKAQEPRKPVGDLYLSIVLPRQHETGSLASSVSHGAGSNVQQVPGKTSLFDGSSSNSNDSTYLVDGKDLCPVCRLPVSTSSERLHTTSLAHQACLPHAYPPSSIDRGRKGLSYLSSYGWDPDARLGLGAQGDGRLYPVRAVARDGVVGIGGEDVRREAVEKERQMRVGKVQQDRIETRRRREASLKADEKNRMLIFGRDDVNQYLGVEL